MRPLLAIGILAAVGCGGGPEYVPVSGCVTLDGKPVNGAAVVFQPVGNGGEAGGYGSTGKTDANGRYSLSVASPEKRAGALVGKHRVSITTRTTEDGTDEIQSRGGETIPARYNSQSTLTVDIPPGGSTEADFGLTTK